MNDKMVPTMDTRHTANDLYVMDQFSGFNGSSSLSKLTVLDGPSLKFLCQSILIQSVTHPASHVAGPIWFLLMCPHLRFLQYLSSLEKLMSSASAKRRAPHDLGRKVMSLP